ncbi:MAG: FtsX-like permease family protein, partial [Pseudomonadota bacterium]
RTEAVAEILSGLAGVEEVAILSTAQSEALLEPWLGVGADLSLLPIPRMVTAQRGAGFNPDAASAALSAVPGASLDDHSGWSERLSAMAATVTGAAMAGLALMLVATAISIVFATRATIATNRDTVEVLHVLGADERFIQRAFRGRFLRIGVRGAALGLGAAAVLFGAMEAWSMLSVGAASQQSAALLGAPSIGLLGFLGLLALALSMALLVALTTRFAVRHHLKDLSQ